MMADKEFGGIVDASKTYTQKSLAVVLDRNVEWVIDNIIHAGCPHFKVGLLLFISGKSFQLFIEANTEKWVPPSERGRRRMS